MRWGWIFGLVVLACAPAQAQLRSADGLSALEAGDAVTARAIWQPLAERGDLLAQYNLGVLAQREGTDPLPWFLRAAEAGHVPSQLALAGQLADRQNWTAAARWYAAAAEQGEARAAHSLGVLHDRGLLGTEARRKAADWFRRAALTGHVPAQFALGALLAEAEDAEAALWFSRAAEGGHIEAKFNHALGLEAEDPAAARVWYARAAQAGFGPASYNLALMLARGKGGDASFRAALTWAIVAEQQGFGQAEALSEALSEVMAPDAQEVARADAIRCLAQARQCPGGPEH